MKTFTISIGGVGNDDVLSAIDEVKRLLVEGYASGNNENDTGHFDFTSEGRWGYDRPQEECPECCAVDLKHAPVQDGLRETTCQVCELTWKEPENE